MDLKTVLKDWQKEKREIDNLDNIIIEMLQNIGSVDAELRDNLIYSTFCDLIIENKLSPNQMKEILFKCLSENFLFQGIGEKGTDSVFTRSFSSLVIALIVGKDKTERFLDKQSLEDIYEKTILYLKEEKDVRGYVEGKGWAHSVAHGADLLATVVSHPSFSVIRAEECLQTVTKCIWKDSVLQDDEDERLIFVVEALIEKSIPEDILAKWVKNFVWLMETSTCNDSLDFFKYRTNVMNFLKSLYFRLSYQGKCVKTQILIKDCLQTLHTSVYSSNEEIIT